MSVIKIFEAFSGYGSQSLLLDLIGVDYECVGISEIDPYAIKAHEALHGVVKNYGDISKIDCEELPVFDLFTYSFPCTDISNAGQQKGFDKDSGTRSSLLWECEKIIKAKRPPYLMLENVKALVNKKNIEHFNIWLELLKNYGYNNYWKIVNAKNCGIPQNRERVFVVSILGSMDDGAFGFEDDFDSGVRLKDLLELEVDEKYYISDEKCATLMSQIKEGTVCIDHSMEGREGFFREYSDYMPTITAREYKEPRQVVVKEATKQGYAIAHEGDSINLEQPNSKTRRGRVGVGVAQTLTTSCNQAVVEPNSAEIENSLTLFKNEINQIGNIVETDSFGGNPQRGRIYGVDGISPALNTVGGGGLEPKVLTPYRIRKLTPRECFRLMGLNDAQIDKIQSTGISNSQQYKMAGNSIVVHQMRFLKNLPMIREHRYAKLLD